MDPSSVYIIGGVNKTSSRININSKVIFLDKVQKGFKNQIYLIKKLQDDSDILRKKFVKLQEDVFKQLQHLVKEDDDYRYLLTNLFFEAAPYKSDTVYKFFKLNLIIDYIVENKIKKLYLVNVTEDIANFFINNSQKLSLYVEKISIKKKDLSLKSQLLRSTLGALFSHLFIEFKKKKNKISTQNSHFKKVVLSSYPGHSFNNGFSSHYFADVSALLNKDYAWLFMYHGRISKLHEESKLIKSKVNSFGFLDSYFSLTNFKEILIDYFRIRKKLKSIKLKNLFIFDKVDYLNLMKSDWLVSISTVLNTLIFEKKFKNFFKINTKIEEIIYLMEYQPWEFVLNKVAHKNNVKTKASIHSILRPNFMNYNCSELIHSFYYIPSYVGANNNLSKARFLENGFSSKQTLKIEAQRYNYLIKNNNMLNQKVSKIRKSILISTSTNYKETKELLEIFFLSNLVFEKVYIKEHPHMPVRSIVDTSIKGFPPYELVEGSVQNAFQLSDIVYVANSSSVLLESVLSKKHTVSLISLSTLPMPAIDKAPNLYFVEDENSLFNTLTKLANEVEIDYTKNAVPNDLYLDKELNLWRKFLKI